MGRAKKNVEVEAQVIARGNVVPMMTETESEEIVQYVSDEDAAREDRLVSEIRMITEQTKQVVLTRRTVTDVRKIGGIIHVVWWRVFLLTSLPMARWKRSSSR